jgi:hypothetical protein
MSKAKLEINRVSKRKYPDIKENDEVRIYTKKKNFQKERVPVWSLNKYTVNKIVNSHGQILLLILMRYNKPNVKDMKFLENIILIRGNRLETE